MHGLASSHRTAVTLTRFHDRMLAQGLALLPYISAAVVPGMVHALLGSPVYYQAARYTNARRHSFVFIFSSFMP